MDFNTMIAQIVTDQAPRVFAVVLEFGEQTDAEIVGWGLELDHGAYMVTADGRNQYALAEPGNALRYLRNRSNVKPHLIWAKRTPGE
ncbi:hypothetical protein ALI144C_15550 [Actinosynnema sp. ALI-1.44]|nr:hypothetical protein ALI144C_15550 [Actinosynnema sp. ALI-1.44]